MTYKYHLLRYKGPKSRLTCPSCGRPHCFSPYVDDKEQPAGPEYGVCNHVNSCGYRKYPPSDYVPKASDFYDHHPQRGKDRRPKRQPVISRPEPKPEPPEGVCTIPFELVRRTVRMKPASNFLQFLFSLFDADTVKRVVCDYCLGVSQSGDTVFYEIDLQDRVRTGKVMKYGPDGHRIKDETMPGRITWVHSLLLKQGVLPEGWTLTQCLFGEHLLKRYPEETVCLVESEKSAVIASAILPKCVWLATGGRSQLGDKLEVLYGRTVIAFPDLDAHQEWTEKLAERPYLNIQVSDLLVQEAKTRALPDNADIADLLIDWLKSDPKGVSQVERVSNPVLAAILKLVPIPSDYHDNLLGLIEDFDLELVSYTSKPIINPETLEQ